MPGGWFAAREHRADLIAVALLVCAIAGLAIKWAPNAVWTSDALFYQARVLEIRGESKDDALREVWEGPLSASFRAADSRRPPGTRVLADPRWVPETARLTERRWTTPLLGAAVYPIFGVDSLEAVSVVGSLAFALLLYTLLRMRFSPLPCFAGVAACLAWPALRWAFLPLTDAWGLAIVTLTFVIAIRYLDSWSPGWVVAWVAAILVLSVTRELTLVPVMGAAAVALVHRSRQAALLAASGMVAAFPAQLLLGTSLPWTLAYAFNGNRVPGDSSWGFVFSHYPSALETGIRHSLDYLLSANPAYLESAWPLAPFTVPLLIGLVVVVIASSDRSLDPFLPFMQGALLGGVALFLILPVFQELRYQYPLLPVAAAGIAITTDGIRRWVTASTEQTTV